MNDIRDVALDVHRETITVAVADLDWDDPANHGFICNRPETVRKLVWRLGEPEQLMFRYKKAD